MVRGPELGTWNFSGSRAFSLALTSCEPQLPSPLDTVHIQRSSHPVQRRRKKDWMFLRATLEACRMQRKLSLDTGSQASS
jgi:hypothetical protein